MNQSAQIVMQPMQWARVQDVHDIEPLSDADSDCLREIRDVLKKYRLTDRFGVSLIHKHFDLSPTEQMVEFTDPVERTLTIKPVDESLDFKTLQTTWKFAEDQAGLQPLTICVYRCYYNPNSTPQHVGQHGAG